ncbi:hypothetical protein BUALT_Bualt03G0223800 [Buddleja alternifolia]|uniref:RING-type domain-containing protein n=1 Tax=Buddleja alternifolia TaxID=168488 RepID=A0AAV6Y090_9LAMI|nr:hypothetical protein BUALT_Bualt03G0223800 [Buddleja alternifolia]
MAISSYPTPADAGVLCVILANTAISISIVKEIVRSILHSIGIHIASWEELSVEPTYSSECHRNPSESYMEEFRTRSPAMMYDSIFTVDCPKQECSICLTEFNPKAEINRLSCGHIFHKSCLEKWLKFWNATCPLCRNYVMPQEVEEDACPILKPCNLRYLRDRLKPMTESLSRPSLPDSSAMSRLSHISGDLPVNSESFDPTDMLLRGMLVLLCLLPTGEDGIEDDERKTGLEKPVGDKNQTFGDEIG